MRELLKVDFKRVFKDKLLLVMGILAVAFALITPLLYAVLFSTGEIDNSMLSGLVSAKGQFFQSFSMGNNLGLIAPVLLAIVLCKDFSYGTVRNKIIAGKSRSAIYLSMWIVCSVVLIGVMFLQALPGLFLNLALFDYQQDPFTVQDFWYFLASIGFVLLVLLFMSALLSWLCACTKNVGAAIVLYVAIALALVTVGGILQVVIEMLGIFEAGNETLPNVLRFLNRVNVGFSVTYIGVGTEYTLADVLYLTLPALAGIAGFTGLGLLNFNRKDLK